MDMENVPGAVWRAAETRAMQWERSWNPGSTSSQMSIQAGDGRIRCFPGFSP